MRERWQHKCRALLMIAILLLTAACRSNSGSGEAYASAVEVKRGSVATVVQMAGQVVAVHSLELDLGSVSGRIVNLAVRTGQEVQAGQELLQLDTTGYQRTLREAEADLKAAEAALQAAQKGSGQGELARAEADLAMAQYGAEHTKMALTLAEESRTGPLKQQVADAAFALRVAQDELRLKEIGEGQAEIRRLEYDQAFRQRVLRDMSPDDPQRAETQKSLAETERALNKARTARGQALEKERDAVQSKQRELARAQEDLDRALQAKDDPAAAARLAYRAAVEALATAQAKVDALKAGGESGAVEAARTAYEAAQAAMQSARASVDAGTLRAPFDGTVVALYVGANDTVASGQKVLFLADFRELRLKAQVTEVEVPRVEVGQTVRVTFDMYPGQIFLGTVLDLPQQVVNQSGIAYYQVVTTLEPGESAIRLGMYGNARILIGERHNVLTIPSASVRYNQMGETYVDVRRKDNGIEQRTVELGMNDGIQVEVLSGLVEGETVMVPLVAATSPYGGGVYMR